MTAETFNLTRAEIASLRHDCRIERGHVRIVRQRGFVDRCDALLNMAEAHLDEPARLAAARAEGVREGIEMAAKRIEGGSFLHDDAPTARFAREAAAAVRRLAPAPAEAPTTPTAEASDGWIEWKGGECPVEAETIVETRYRNGDGDDARPARRFGWDHWGGEKGDWDIIAYRIVQPAEASAPVAEVACVFMALDAERSRADAAEAARDAALARAMPEPVLMETVEQVEALPGGRYVVRFPTETEDCLFEAIGTGRWFSVNEDEPWSNLSMVGAWISGPLPDLPIPPANGDAP